MPFDILRFRETYFEMIWGGHRLGERAGVEEASSLFERGETPRLLHFRTIQSRDCGVSSR